MSLAKKNEFLLKKIAEAELFNTFENKSAERRDGSKLLRSLTSAASWIIFLTSFVVVCGRTYAGADLFSTKFNYIC